MDENVAPVTRKRGALCVRDDQAQKSARREPSAFHAREKKKKRVRYNCRSVVVRNKTNSAFVVVVGALSTRFSPRGVSSRAFAVDA
jgi:uncharacterized lipoprotein